MEREREGPARGKKSEEKGTGESKTPCDLLR